jgi:hypothetical protein
MAAAAYDSAFAKKAGVPQTVAKEYSQENKGGKLLKQAMQIRALRKK